jgi:hypothetical protein
MAIAIVGLAVLVAMLGALVARARKELRPAKAGRR